MVDPLAHMDPSISPYNYCNNNPIVFIDPYGLDEIYYDDQGNEVNRNKRSWLHNLLFGHTYYVQGSENAPNTYNDQNYSEIEGPLDPGEINGVVENTEELVLNFVEENASEGSFPINASEVIKKSPENAKWDMKNTDHLENNKIYILNGKGYRSDYIGNVAWSYIMAASGWPLPISLMAAGAYQTYSTNRSLEYWIKNPLFLGDDPRDSGAIMRGYWLRLKTLYFNKK